MIDGACLAHGTASLGACRPCRIFSSWRTALPMRSLPPLPLGGSVGGPVGCPAPVGSFPMSRYYIYLYKSKLTRFHFLFRQLSNYYSPLHPPHLHFSGRLRQDRSRRRREYRAGPPPFQARGQQVRPSHGAPPSQTLRELPREEEAQDQGGPHENSHGTDESPPNAEAEGLSFCSFHRAIRHNKLRAN